MIKRILSQFIKDDLLQGLSPHRDIKLMSLTYRKSDLTVVYEKAKITFGPSFSDPEILFLKNEHSNQYNNMISLRQT